VKWYVYILRCDDGSYYVGHTNNVENRFTRHKDKTGARHTAAHAPEEVLYRQEFSTEVEAMKRERQLKRWTRAKKEALIRGDLEKLQELSKSRDK